MTSILNRRRFLMISAAAGSVAGTEARAARPVARWSGSALGAKASMQLVGIDAREAAPIFTAMQAEIWRLENIFSLYRAGSEVSRLNREGRLERPSPDLLSLLGICATLHTATDGAFDPTVQPIFARSAAVATRAPDVSEAERERAVSLVGWEDVRIRADVVRLLRPGAALTLNGIAQGYITDRIAAFLKSHGFADILVDMGEIVASGRRSDGAAWRAGIADPNGTIHRRMSLSNRALATSAPKGTILNAAGPIGHIFDPLTGREASSCSIISVSGPEAVIADGLSTALCVLPAHRRADVLARFSDCRIELAT